MAVSVYQPVVSRGKKLSSMSSGEKATESKSSSIGGITTTLSEGNHEMLAIKIIIPPKPKGMNPGPYCVTDDDNSGTVYSTFPVIPNEGGKNGNVDYEAVTQAMDVSSQSAIDVKSLISQDEDLAASKLPFVWKLYEMLEDVEANGREDIVSWIDQGRGFKVHNMEKFVDEVIPKYFRQSKYKSFQRQLYFYDFHRVSNGPHAGAYKHPKFLKGVKTQCLSMMPKKTCRRRTSKGKLLEAAEPESACSTDVGVTTEESSTCGASTNSSEEWMSAKTQQQQQQQQQTISRDRYSIETYPSYSRDRHSSLSSESGGSYYKNETQLRRSGPGDGDTVFVFGDRAFHYVDVTFDDIYPPSCSSGPTRSSRYHHTFHQDYRDSRAASYGHSQIEGI